MDTWLQITLAAIALVSPWIGAYFGSQKGVAVAQAKAALQISALEREVNLLREAKHEHANVLTRHEADIDHIKRHVRLGD